MTELAIRPQTLVRLETVANEKGATVEDLAEQAIHQYLREEARHKMRQENRAFRLMHAELLDKYAGEYVAVYQGQVVDHDPDQLALFLRIDKQYPDTPVFIAQVLSESEEIYTFRSPRIEYG